MIKNISIMILATMLMIALLSSSSSHYELWPVPEKYRTMENPVSYDSESIQIGKSLYSKHCKSCHGKEGLGDGSKADQLDTPCGDFTDDVFTSQTDGSLYYKTIKGRDDMPAFEKKIPDSEDIWHLVNYLRSLSE
jgi:mono/diheme cytochrome c family protein